MKDNAAKWVEILRPVSRAKSFFKGEHIFYADSPAERFYYLEKGEIKLYKLDSGGKETEVRRVMPADIFAEVVVFAGFNYPVSAIAVKDSLLLCYEKKDVLEYTKKDNKLALFFIEILAKRCLYLNQTIDNVSLQEIPVRLARYLLAFVKDNQNEVINNTANITLPFAKKDLANILGTIPETLSRALKKLHDNRWIEINGKTIKILDLSGLKNYSN